MKEEGTKEEGMKKEAVRGLLNDEAGRLFDDIVNSRVLGANNHIRLIGEILILIAQDEAEQGTSVFERLRKTAEFFMETRGRQSRAVYHAIRYYIKDLKSLEELPAKEIRNAVRARIGAYRENAKRDMEALVSHGIHLSENMAAILIFDYSSTVDRFVGSLPGKRDIYIPESRALDGGRPFVNTAVEAGHRVHFIPDTAMLQALKKCRAAFMGAETVYPDGTVFNTVGSDILAVLCRHAGIPLYVMTPMIKVDIRPVYGYVRLSPMPFDYGIRMAGDWDPALRGRVDFKGNKLLEVEPGYVRALITEKGIIPPGAFFGQAMEYAGELEGR